MAQAGFSWRFLIVMLLTEYVVKFLVDLFLVVGVGTPTSLLIVGEGERYIQRFVLASVLLSGLYSYMIFMVGTFFGLMSRTIYTTTVALVLVLPFLSSKTRHELVRVGKRSPSTHVRLGMFEVAGFAIIIMFLATTFLQGLASTSVLDDPVAVWLYLGKQIYLTGKLPLYYGNAPDISWAGNWPPNAAFIAAGQFLLLNRVDAFDYALIPWVYGAVGLLATYLLVRELAGSSRAAIFAVLVTLFTTIYPMIMMGWGYVDTLITFYITAFLAFTFMKSGPVDQNGLFAVLAFSLAALSKYNAFLVLIPSIFILVMFKPNLFRLTSRGHRKTWTLVLLVAFVILGASWYVRNWVLVGDPLYPYLYNLLSDRGVTRSVISLVPTYHEPLSMIWSDPTFTGLTNQGNLWPLIVLGGAGITLPVVGAGGHDKKMLRALALWSLISLASLLAFMAARGGFERYLIMLVPGIAACAGFLVEPGLLARPLSGHDPARVRRVVRRAAVPSLLLALVLVSPGYAYLLEPPRQPPPEFLGWLNQVNGVPAGTFATNDLRLYYFDHPVVALWNIVPLFGAKSTHETWQILRNDNVSYVYYSVRFDGQVFETHTLLVQTLQDPSFATLLFADDSRYPSFGDGLYRLSP